MLTLAVHGHEMGTTWAWDRAARPSIRFRHLSWDDVPTGGFGADEATSAALRFQ